MIAFSAKNDVEISRFVYKLRKMARKGKKSPHPDGWGFFCKDSFGNILYNRSIVPIFDDDVPNFRASSCIIHARKASPGTSKGILSVHPFLFTKGEKVFALAHNGSVKVEKRDVLRMGVDTELIVRVLSKGSLEDIPRKFHDGSTSTTLFLSDGNMITAMRCCWKSCDYYTLFLEEEDGIITISSEGNGRELRNGEIVTLKDGKIIDVKLVDCQRSI